jgi:hypothetical protein
LLLLLNVKTRTAPPSVPTASNLSDGENETDVTGLFKSRKDNTFAAEL